VKRSAYIFAALSLLLIADGVYLEVSNNQQGCGCNGDSGTLFGGSTSINLSTGTEVLIGGQAQASPAAQAGQAEAAKAQGGQAQAANAPVGQSPAMTEVTAGQGQVAKETGDQLS